MLKRDKSRSRISIFYIPVIFCITVIFISLFGFYSPAMAQNFRDAETYVWQDFEYWHAPANYGWKSSCPPYPTFGWCPYTGFGRIETILCPILKSRVLFYTCMISPFNQFYPFFAWNERVTYPDGSPINDKSIISFDIAAPMGIEPWDTWEVQVMLMSRNGNQIMLIYCPVGECEQGPTFREGKVVGDIFYGEFDPPGFLYNIGRQYNQGAGSWNHIVRDLDRDIDLTDDGLRNYSDGYGSCNNANPGKSMVLMVKFQHPQLRVDNIAFHKCSLLELGSEPYLFKIGPRYAQIFEPYRYLFCAEDTQPSTVSVLDLMFLDSNYRLPQDNGYVYPGFENIFEKDPNKIKSYWLAQGADPNAFDKNSSQYLKSDPVISAAMGRDFVIYPWLPVFKDPNLRWDNVNGFQNPAFQDITGTSGINRTLLWNATVGGLGASGIQFKGIAPLPIDPVYDGMPTYMPIYDRSGEYKTVLGKSFLGPYEAATLEAALYNAGFLFWPNFSFLDFTPQVFEDIILTIEVTDGRTSDVETFPISVVNYPVENYPPYIEDVDDQIFAINGRSEYALSFVDPDCFIFSTAPYTTGQPCATNHTPMGYGEIRTDMDNITWEMTLNGLSSYQYGPWMQSMIDQKTGIISFIPQFEGAYYAIIAATDNFGASSITEFTIFCITQGTWLNHPPVILGDWDHPQVANAGEQFILTAPEFKVIDPDGDKLYFSSNIGSCGFSPSGDFMWSLSTYWPGYYQVEIIAYDIRGGYAIVTIDLEVKPWWSL